MRKFYALFFCILAGIATNAQVSTYALYSIAGYTGDIRYEVIGSAPNRQLVL